jgi:hypothetical protein
MTDGTDCTRVIDEPTVRDVFDRVVAVVRSQAGGCTLDRVDGEPRAITIGLVGPEGAALPPLRVEPAECVASLQIPAGSWTITVPAETERACPAVVARTREALAAPAEPSGPAGPRGTWGPLAWIVGVDFALVALGTVALAARALRRADRRWTGLIVSLLAIALVVRFAVEPTLLTWYADVLPASGPPSSPSRFGPGGAVLQAALRAVLPWRESTPFAANAALGALAVPVFAATLRERAVPLAGAACATLLFALDPLHVRASASPREHVLASTLTLLLLLCWVRAARPRARLELALALLLVPAVVFTRVDAWPQLAAVPLWTLLRDRTEPRAAGAGRRTTWFAAAWFAAVWLAVGAAAWIAVVRPSHHPGPEPRAQLDALRTFVTQFFVLAWRHPRWVSPVTAALCVVGAARMARSRPRLLACVLLTLALAFVPLGRTLEHDALMGAHYFLAALAVFTLPAAYALTRPLAIAAASGLALALALPAYRTRYTCQAEYAFLRRALAALPDGCTVHTLPVRDVAFGRDLDCCVDTARSPLVLAYPRLQFVESADPLRSERAPRAGACVAWYDGAACSLSPARAPPSYDGALPIVRSRCDAMRRISWTTVARARVAAVTPDPLFEEEPDVAVLRLAGEP